MLSTKATLASGTPKTENNSVQAKSEENVFHARLKDPMNEASTHENQTDSFFASLKDTSTHNTQANSFFAATKDASTHDAQAASFFAATKDASTHNTQASLFFSSDINDSKNIKDTNHESKALLEPGPNLLKVLKGATISLSDEQNIFETSNKSGPNKVAVDETGYPQRVSGINTINKPLDPNNNPGNDSSRLNIERESSNPTLQTTRDLNRHNSVLNAMFEAKDNATTNNTSMHNTLLNPEENANGKIVENLKEQQSDKTSTANTGTKSPSQQGFAKVDPDNSESSIIFNTNAKSAEANFGKSSDTANTNNNSVITGDVTSSANTSSDNSSFNNQSSNILSEFDINSVNTRKNAVPETNFTDTLSQINNASKPLGTIGNNVTDNIIQSAKLYMEGGKSEIKIRLDPPELGILKLEFSLDDDILDAKIKVERSAVKDIIEKDIPRLRELISGADVDVGKLDVSLQEKEENDRFGFMDKNLQPDPESDSTQDSSNREKEHFENEEEEEPIIKNRDSNQINYLV